MSALSRHSFGNLEMIMFCVLEGEIWACASAKLQEDESAASSDV